MRFALSSIFCILTLVAVFFGLAVNASPLLWQFTRSAILFLHVAAGLCCFSSETKWKQFAAFLVVSWIYLLMVYDVFKMEEQVHTLFTTALLYAIWDQLKVGNSAFDPNIPGAESFFPDWSYFFDISNLGLSMVLG